MPQINRIRVNNVKYNFGTQYYDDFLMRFSCKNSLYDLANGGGKSVLMLLLLQNLIPNCTLDDKQPIEKLFRSGNANTAIHSLVEWKLDACDVKNGYKYMVTGFCARKGKEDREEDAKNIETANIDYFNYCIFYKEFGENDIKNLPLSNGKERIGYNSLKAYLRDLEKHDYGVEVKIFERKGDYQNFISNYGLYESQWEIVRGINKTEGHVRTYFENSYKTTRKIIEDLLIEGIIEKSYNNRIRKGDEDDTQMAKTLMDIKGKLIELAKRREDINNYDEQINLLNAFSERLDGFKNIYQVKKILENELISYLVACRKKLAGEKQKNQALLDKKAVLEANLEENKRLQAITELELELLELDKIEALIEETKSEKEVLVSKQEKVKEELKFMEAATDYFEYLDCKHKYDELKELINNSDANKSDVVNELKKLAATKFKMNAVKEEEYGRLISEKKQKLAELISSHELAKEEKLNVYGTLNKEQGLIDELASEIETINAKLDELMSESGIIAAVNAVTRYAEISSEIETCKKNISKYENMLQDEKEKFADFKQRVIETDAKLTLTGEEIDRTSKELDESTKKYNQLENIKNVYGEASKDILIEKIEKILRNLQGDIVRLTDEETAVKDYVECLKNQSLPDYEKHYVELADNLKKRFSDVVTGKEFLMNFGESKRHEIMKEFPQVIYAIFAEENYDEISRDKSIYRLNTGSYMIPVLKISDFDVNSNPFENMLVAYKDMSFIFDESGVKAELDRVYEDLDRLDENLAKLKDKYEVIEADLYETKYIIGYENPAVLAENLEKLKKSYEKLDEEKQNSVESVEVIRERINAYADSLENENLRLKELTETLTKVAIIKEQNELLNDKYSRKKTSEQRIHELSREHSNLSKKVSHLEEEITMTEREKNILEEKVDSMNQSFEQGLKPYYDESVVAMVNVTEEDVDAKAGALLKLVMEERGELADKEKLLLTYEAGMKKAIDNLKYHAMTIEAAKDAMDNGMLKQASLDDKLECKARLDELNSKMEKLDETINSEQTQKSRIEGSIWHGQKLYEEKYGEFVRENINNPQGSIIANKQEAIQINEKIKAISAEIKALEDSNKDVLLMEKDLARIVRNAGIDVTEEISVSEDEIIADISTEAYEAVQKQYEKICKDEVKRRNVFVEEKQKLTDSLTALKAYELAEEIKKSLTVPADAADVDLMIQGLKDTNDCIALERDNIEQGIRDMQKIKENFEERCIQICSNIRSELERLPKLSRINLDDEVISMITLSIPYIKEELFKDRMSVYINETVSCAETLGNADEKLKYIKSQLSWKKLFSVIVTDMNSIKLCLYKREHIKDQSRYLKYEEAVGSTGQSQGIYIQFLIAVIHYISNINAAGRDTGATGKTIFIDNPFGAAKDVYIWEPIFKLLKTNHVQLIVPARGATPAITRMFDVNYILGQKLVGERQQTVVVDYRSQVNMEEMEASVLEYEQSTLNLD